MVRGYSSGEHHLGRRVEYAREPADQHVPNVPQGRRRRRCIPRILGVTERPRHGRGAEQRRRLRHCH